VIWHIFKKDARLLWPLVAILAVADAIYAALGIELGHFGEPRQLAMLAAYFQLGLWLGIAALTILLVHQDPLPGDRQDWLVRPIKRSDLLFAKLLFLLLAIQGPIVLINLVVGLMEGFHVGDAIQAILWSSAAFLLLFNFAAFGAATITRTMGALIGWMIAITVAVVGAEQVAFETMYRSTDILSHPLNGTGFWWIIDTGECCLALLAASVVVGLQYFFRATNKSISVVVTAVLMAMMLPFLTVPKAFGLQTLFADGDGAAASIAIAFAPDLGRAPKSPNEARATALQLPVRLSGMPSESFIGIDRAAISLLDENGTLLYRGSTILTPGEGKYDLLARLGTRNTENIGAYQQIALPQKIIDAVGDKPVKMEIDYLLTLVQIDGSMVIPALNGNARKTGFGWCRSRVDDDDGNVDVGCKTVGEGTRCITATLKNRISGARNPDNERCQPDYEPGHLGFSPLKGRAISVTFHDPKGLAQYPVDGPQLRDSDVILKSYKPVAHFARHLEIPKVRISDWAVQISGFNDAAPSTPNAATGVVLPMH